MAEGRMLKKAISRSRKLAELQTDSARLLYTWLIPHLDVEGRFYGDPAVIRGSIVPRINTYTEKKIIEYLQDMQKVGLIFWYEIEGDYYLQFTVFEKHQTLRKDRESQSQIPAPLLDNSGSSPGIIPLNIIEVKLNKDKRNKERGNISIFTKPTIEEVTAYCRERNNNVNPQIWIDHYISNGWMVGKNKMKNWKAAIRTWEARNTQNQTIDDPGSNNTICRRCKKPASLLYSGNLCEECYQN